MLPSKLEIPLTFADGSGHPGVMRDPMGQCQGGMADITTAQMYDKNADRDIKVAVKTVRGGFLKDNQVVSYLIGSGVLCADTPTHR